ncbi:MAG: HD domain-containing protein [Proteobacteria bacterium]|nr:HD domain-containing protein [Pseudomonadota bacterium]
MDSKKQQPGGGLVERAVDRAREFFRDPRASHDWDHTERVMALCRRLGPAEGADMEILLVAAALHDIARGEQDASRGAVCHAEAGARLAAGVMADLGLTGPRRENVLHCIRTHRFRGSEAPATLEARVLFDCDKLDSIGAVGVARAFQFAGEVGARLHNRETDLEATRAYSEEDTGYREYRVKLSRVADRMLTDHGRLLAKKRHAFMTAFFRRFLREHAGEI